ncbi:MAG TPA: transporter [Cyanobacteria bacterium UBA11149]|nr:transporter [Cyanobacteria bacterium UBA11367]HBE59286.1 transporter [Cyanobacteria bacterium UBA11366]HBK64845.1 transporter [Cyanobacteria bacterium UBA11166]HBW91834.1 transporter [Cyanobacteria bacterium UBA11149]HCA96092.1 transporter [Cyanobacteria bacterium UBA9226]
MPRKDQGWITFQSSDEERQILEQICQESQRTKTEVLREMIRQMGKSPSSIALNLKTSSSGSFANEFFEDLEEEEEKKGDESIKSTNTAMLQTVQISTRNILRAKVKRIIKGTVNVEVTLEIASGVELVSIITRISADKLRLTKGKEVFALIKSSSVMIAG